MEYGGTAHNRTVYASPINCRTQPERYAKYCPTFLQNIIKHIDKNKVKNILNNIGGI
jgi:hypothetical protein